MPSSPNAPPERFAGRRFTPQDLQLISAVVADYPNLSRHELAATVCELLTWERPNGQLKTRECRDLLECLQQCGQLTLPAKGHGRPAGAVMVTPTLPSPATPPIDTGLAQLQPITLTLVRMPEQQTEWRALIAHHHYLGYRTPFGAQLRYLIHGGDAMRPLGALQYSSPAWRMRARDAWIGWDDATRKRRLQAIVCQSRFLILPSVQVKNLASHVLALSARQIADDWFERYRVRPLLIESLVDESRFSGTCYRAANWIRVGKTSGRGRSDTSHQRHGAAPKLIFLFPLEKDAREKLASCQNDKNISHYQ